MQITKNKIVTCLWFNNEAEEAAKFYVSVFRNATLGKVTKFGKAGLEKHQQAEGKVLSAIFNVNGQEFVALNGGPMYKFSEAISFQILCDTQEEIDEYWAKLTEHGMEQQCGWLKDKYGVSWQIIPSILPTLLTNPEKASKVTAAFLKMKKFDIATLLGV